MQGADFRPSDLTGELRAVATSRPAQQLYTLLFSLRLVVSVQQDGRSCGRSHVLYRGRSRVITCYSETPGSCCGRCLPVRKDARR